MYLPEIGKKHLEDNYSHPGYCQPPLVSRCSLMLKYMLTLHYLIPQNHCSIVSCWAPCYGTFPPVWVQKQLSLCGELCSVRSRLSARPLHAARRPAVPHQPASLPPWLLLQLRAHAQVLRFTPILFYCQYWPIWRIGAWRQTRVKSRLLFTGSPERSCGFQTPYNKELHFLLKVFFLLHFKR